MFAEISSAITSAKTALEIAKAANGLTNYNELVAAVSEVNSKLLDATAVVLASQERQSALMDEVRALKDELAKMRRWDEVAKEYRLQAVGVEKRHFAQIYRPAIEGAKARHWACAKCFQEQKLYILSAADNRYTYQCPNCKTEISPIVQGAGLAPIETAYE